jgi:replicative DNA helicase
MSKRLLRGIIDFGDAKLTIEQIDGNYRRLLRSGFEWYNPDETKIWTYVQEYVQQNLEPPDWASIRDYFERNNEITVVEKLADIKTVEAYTRSNYGTLLKTLREEQAQNKVRKLLRDVEEIITKGRVEGKTQLKGVTHALQYFNQHIYEEVPRDHNIQIEGDIVHDTERVWAEYQDAKSQKDKAYGKFTGIDHIDKTCHGIKKGELWVHAAATGELKSSFAINWCYNLATRYRTHSLYVSLEMRYEHLRRLLAVMHTSNGKFVAQGRQPLDYRKVRDGELTKEEEAFYKEALHDLENNPEYHKIRVYSPDRKVGIDDIRVYAESVHRSMDVGLLVVDHSGLVKAARAHKDYTVEHNTVIVDAKLLALHFNGGTGLPVLLLHQINRQGKDAADKQEGTEKEGVYRFSNLSYANEAERSADYVTTSYLCDSLRAAGETIFCNLKNRDNDLFSKVKVKVDFANARRLRNLEGQESFNNKELTKEDLRLLNEAGL